MGMEGEGAGDGSNTCSQDPTLSRFPPPPARHPGYTRTGLKYAQAVAQNFFLISISS